MENNKTTKLIDDNINSNSLTNLNSNSYNNINNKEKLSPYPLNKINNLNQNENSTLLIHKNEYPDLEENQVAEKKHQKQKNRNKEKFSKLNKITIEEFFSKLKKTEEKIKIFQVIGYISFFIFLFLVLLKLIIKNYGQDSISYYIILISIIFTILSFIISYNFFLYMKQLIEMDENEILNKENNNNSGNIFSFISLNIFGILLMIYFLLLAIKLETKENSLSLNIVNIPVYISLTIAFFYFIYIFPALINNRLYWDIALIISYIINILTFSVLSNMKFDLMKNISNVEWFIPLYIAFSLHFIYSIYDLIKGKTYLIFRIFFSISILLVFIGTIFISIILDKDKKEYNKIYIGLLIYLSAYSLFIIEKISVLIFGVDIDDENNNNNINNNYIDMEERDKL